MFTFIYNQQEIVNNDFKGPFRRFGVRWKGPGSNL